MTDVKNYMELRFEGVGRILLAAEDGRLTELSFLKDRKLPEGLNFEETPLLAEARRQLEEYFDGSRRAFELPLAPKGDALPAALLGCAAKNPVRQDRDLRGHSARRRLAERLPRPRVSPTTETR